MRNNSGRSFHALQHGPQARVAFLGGSITEMDGWRTIISDYLQNRFPHTLIDFINAGISSTDTTLGSHRMRQDVFFKGKVDLLFVEFAVNERVNGRQEEETIRGLEGIIRQALRHNENVEIILLYSVDDWKMEDIRSGITPSEIVTMEEVADYYQLTSIDLSKEITGRIDAGEFDWKTFGGLHPAPFGHAIYAETIQSVLETCWMRQSNQDLNLGSECPASLASELDPFCYQYGHYASVDQASNLYGFQRNPNWRPAFGETRPQFVDVPLLEGNHPGDSVSFTFRGSSIGILVPAGFDAGIIQYAVDNKKERELDLFTDWSQELHIPWAFTLESELVHGEHTINIQISEKKNSHSAGHAVRIISFLVN